MSSLTRRKKWPRLIPALKRRAKVSATLRVETLAARYASNPGRPPTRRNPGRSLRVEPWLLATRRILAARLRVETLGARLRVETLAAR